VEFLIVFLIGTGVVVSLLIVCAWVFLGWFETQYHKTVQVCIGLNTNWKVGLIILVPIFFRPIRTFLEKAKKLWGAEAQESGEQSPGKGKYTP